MAGSGGARIAPRIRRQWKNATRCSTLKRESLMRDPSKEVHVCENQRHDTSAVEKQKALQPPFGSPMGCRKAVRNLVDTGIHRVDRARLDASHLHDILPEIHGDAWTWL